MAREMHERLSWYRGEGIDFWRVERPASGTVPEPAISTIPDNDPVCASSPPSSEPERRSLFDVDGEETRFPSIASQVPPMTPPMTLKEIREEIGDCQRCKLSGGRKNIVFGSGNPNAALMFVGEAPGEDEDLQGLPFVGRAGQLLTKMIVAMGLSRDDVFIANIIKCRPPANRNPQPDEIAACRPFLEKQIRAIRPKVICALGSFSAQTLLSTQQKISQLRGRFHDYQGFKVLPTFHPAYLLRNPNEKKTVWEDLKKVMEELKKEGTA